MKYIEDRPLRVAGEPYPLHLWRLLRWVSELRLVPAATETARNPLRRPLIFGPAARLTRPGKILTFAAVVLLLLSFRRGESFAMQTSALISGTIVWAALVGWWYRPRVEARRLGSSWAVANQPYRAQVQLSHRGTRPLRNLVVREMHVRGFRLPSESLRPHLDQLPQGGQISVPIEVTPQSRGNHRLDGVVVDSYFPFFLTRSSQKISLPQPLSVLPPAVRFDLASLRLMSDQAAKSVRFGTDKGRRERALDYAFSRNFQSGDPPARLDRRASARRGEPMSKVFHGALKLNPQGLVLVVDMSLASLPEWQPRPNDPAEIDRRLALAVEVERRARGEGLKLDGCWWNGVWQPVANTDDFYRQVAGAEARHQRNLPTQLDHDDWIHVLVTGRWDQQVDSWVERHRASGFMVLVLLLPEAPEYAGELPIIAGYTELPR